MTKSSFKHMILILGIVAASTFFYIIEFNSDDIDSKTQSNNLSSKAVTLSSKNQSDNKVKTAHPSLHYKDRSAPFTEDNSISEKQQDLGSVPEDYHNAIQQSEIKANWEKERFSKKQDKPAAWPAIPDAKGKLELPFPPPPNATENEGDNISSFDFIVDSLAQLILPAAAYANAGQYGNITLDGNLSDWSIDDRINLPLDPPPYLAMGDELYGKYNFDCLQWVDDSLSV